jgi:hypothetical protein
LQILTHAYKRCCLKRINNFVSRIVHRQNLFTPATVRHCLLICAKIMLALFNDSNRISKRYSPPLLFLLFSFNSPLSHRIIQDDNILPVLVEVIEAELTHIKSVFALHPLPAPHHNYGNYRSDPPHVALEGYPRFPIDVVDSPVHAQHVLALSEQGLRASLAPQPSPTPTCAPTPIPAIVLPPAPRKPAPKPAKKAPSPPKPLPSFDPPPPVTWAMILEASASSQSQEVLYHPVSLENLSQPPPPLPPIASLIAIPDYPSPSRVVQLPPISLSTARL